MSESWNLISCYTDLSVTLFCYISANPYSCTFVDLECYIKNVMFTFSEVKDHKVSFSSHVMTLQCIQCTQERRLLTHHALSSIPRSHVSCLTEAHQINTNEMFQPRHTDGSVPEYQIEQSL